ncbi:GNAT family N-acetyltransferase [Bosea sp. (in: a-proteobacteria)]|uniref:GNAT family N-acetyltransferase n=1 Tax=Bosea sp. (in: a-proteobacteria) TaxID=1871050 RepID=UPI00260CCD7E|nr:GNAT family N-acetyltransferase [Bosea sp. (in: a-proteobacteria)]MCO5090658.1 GNAT family N-acetyltransferase [Bosea sp. (in: a-proteobacteria)]
MDAAAYQALLASDPGNLIYGTPEFLSFLRRATGAETRILLARREGELVGALAFAISTAADLGPVVNSLPWWGSHGSVLLDRTSPDADAVRAALARAFADAAEEIGALSSTLILLPAENDSRPVYERAYRPDITEGRIGQMTTLPQDGADLDERLLALFGQKTRNLVRKSLKQGFVERSTDAEWAWDFLAETHAQNIAALGGRSKPRSHFTALREAIPPAMRRLAVAMDGERPVAAMLTLSFNGTVEYLTPAIRVEDRPRQPLSFLILNGMREAVRRGERVWNWGGTGLTQTSLHHFKAGFGADDRPYTYLIRASARGLALFRQRKRELGDLFPFFYAYPYGLLDDPA